jgi:hypothetical protein
VLAHQVSVRIPHSSFVQQALFFLHPALVSGCLPFLALVVSICPEICLASILVSACPLGVDFVEAIVDLLVGDWPVVRLLIFLATPTSPVNDPVGVLTSI